MIPTEKSVIRKIFICNVYNLFLFFSILTAYSYTYTEFPCLLGHPVRAHNSLRSTRRSPSGLWRGTTVGRRAADFKYICILPEGIKTKTTRVQPGVVFQAIFSSFTGVTELQILDYKGIFQSNIINYQKILI